jgi:ribose-phosphate pyrophosphokinase
MTPLLLPLPGNERLARSLAQRTGWQLGVLETRTFPDEETYLRLEVGGGARHVVLVCTLDRPDAKTLPLLFAAATARELGSTRVGLVAPYLAYMRQDRRFRKGEAITSRIFAELLSTRIDWLVTVDPHLHRYRTLEELYRIPARVVHAAPTLASWIAANVERPLLVGPDEESSQWVADVGERSAAPFVVLRKIRRGDRDVEVSVPEVDRHHGRTPVILDDIVSSARTMIQTAKHLVAAGLSAPVCVGVHGVFAGDAERALREAGVARIVTTNSVVHPTNAIAIEDLLVPPLLELSRDAATDAR